MKTYELTLSKNYVHSWKLKEAIREIMQNAIDSEADGNEMSLSYNNGTLTVTNYGVNLEASTLVMGGDISKRNDDSKIGGFSEGYKLALIVLLREGMNVKIYTNNQIWIPQFRMSENYGIETMHIDVFEFDEYDFVEQDDMISFEISGMPYEEFKKIRDKNISMLRNMGYSIGDTINSEYGEILLDKEYAGKMFVSGLFIQEDSTFKYGYNFNPQYVKLDRDRSAVNYYELKELTAKALSNQPNIEIVKKSISKSYIDTKSLEDVIDDASKEFIDNFSNDFMKRHNIDEDTFVGTENEVKFSDKSKHVETAKIIAVIVNKGLDRECEYEEVVEKAKNSSDIDVALKYYEQSRYKKLIEFAVKYSYKFNEEEMKEFIDIIDSSSFQPSYFHRIKSNILNDFKNKVVGTTDAKDEE